MAELHIYKNSIFEPIMLPHEHAHLITASKEFDVECIAVGALPEYEKDFGALTAVTWDTGGNQVRRRAGYTSIQKFTGAY